MNKLLQTSRRIALRIPLLWMALAAMTGILAADGKNLLWFLPLAPLSLLLFRPDRRFFLLLGGIVISGTAFFYHHQQTVNRIDRFPLKPELQTGRQIEVTGRGWIDSDPYRRTGRSMRVELVTGEITVRETPIPLASPVRLVALIDHPLLAELEYGSEIVFSGKMERIPRATSPGAFDPAAYFYRSAHSIAQLEINAGNRCEATGQVRGSPIRLIAMRTRAWMESALLHGVDRDEQGVNGLIIAMVLGAREKSPDDVEDLFRLSGTMHLFAVSGLHVGVVAVLLWFVLKWCGISRRTAVLVIIPAVLFYALLTGLRPSSFRAAIMLATFLAGFALKKPASPLNGLGLAALILLTLNTQQLFLPGFQLSFSVVLALILGARILSDLMHRPFQIDPFLPRKRVPGWRKSSDWAVRTVSGMAGLSAASWIGSVALMNSHFSGIAPVGLVANIFMVPVASGIVIIAMISILTFGVRAILLTAWLNQLNVTAASFLTALAQFFSTMPGAHVHTGNERPGTRGETLGIDILGRGGDQAILIGEGRKNWMLDCGNTDTFRHVVLPMLRNRGINRLECLVLSHGDSGHIGAAPYLLSHLRPGLLIESTKPNRARVYPQIVQRSEKYEIPGIEVQAGQTLRWNDRSSFAIFHPDESSPPTGQADDRCLVLMLTSGPWRILFTFDTGFLVEKKLLDEDWNLKADIWIRGSHASTPTGSPEFIEAIDPQVIISSAADFPPHERLSDDWIRGVETRGIKLISLEEAGSVRIGISPEKLEVIPFLGNELEVLPR